MASGIIGALDDEKVQQFPIITGQDAELNTCRNIVNGKQGMTVYKSLKSEAETAATLALSCAKKERNIKYDKKIFNGKIEVPSILIKPKSVDVTNMESTVIAEGFLSRTDVFGK
jgi:D-xylose transport system substrate-binding protein